MRVGRYALDDTVEILFAILKRGRKLKEDAGDFIFQSFIYNFHKLADFGSCIMHSFGVSHNFMCFHRKDKIIRNGAIDGLQWLHFWKSVEREIQLDGIKACSIVC